MDLQRSARAPFPGAPYLRVCCKFLRVTARHVRKKLIWASKAFKACWRNPPAAPIQSSRHGIEPAGATVDIRFEEQLGLEFADNIHSTTVDTLHGGMVNYPCHRRC